MAEQPNEIERRRLDALGDTARSEAAAAEADFQSAVQHAIRAGEALTEVKGLLRHGQWLPWLRENFPLSERTARNYMRLAENRQRVADLPSVREAVALLTAPRLESGNAAADLPAPEDSLEARIEAIPEPDRADYGDGHLEEASFHLAVAEAAPTATGRCTSGCVTTGPSGWPRTGRLRGRCCWRRRQRASGSTMPTGAASGPARRNGRRRLRRRSGPGSRTGRRATPTTRSAASCLWTSARCSSTTPSTCSPTGTGRPRERVHPGRHLRGEVHRGRHGSIPTQVKDCRALAERQGWTVVGVETDEAFSAFSGNRGPGLERAKVLAASTAAEHGRCLLVAQDADRFARGAGDAPGAADHLAEVYFSMRCSGWRSGLSAAASLT